ncbi:MAG: hypothetical protein ACLFTU_09880, partial [Puniceicoccaceae bacterium]
MGRTGKNGSHRKKLSPVSRSGSGRAEAATVYRDAAAVFSGEMHSVILALAAGTPAMLFRLQATGDAADALANGLDGDEHVMSDGLKGRMMSDLGLDDWLIHHSEQADPEAAARTLLRIVEDETATARTMTALAERLATLQTQTMKTLREAATPGCPRNSRTGVPSGRLCAGAPVPRVETRGFGTPALTGLSFRGALDQSPCALRSSSSFRGSSP